MFVEKPDYMTDEDYKDYKKTYIMNRLIMYIPITAIVLVFLLGFLY